jgi:hypothetical protein
MGIRYGANQPQMCLGFVEEAPASQCDPEWLSTSKVDLQPGGPFTRAADGGAPSSRRMATFKRNMAMPEYRAVLEL